MEEHHKHGNKGHHDKSKKHGHKQKEENSFGHKEHEHKDVKHKTKEGHKEAKGHSSGDPHGKGSHGKGSHSEQSAVQVAAPASGVAVNIGAPQSGILVVPKGTKSHIVRKNVIYRNQSNGNGILLSQVPIVNTDVGISAPGTSIDKLPVSSTDNFAAPVAYTRKDTNTNQGATLSSEQKLQNTVKNIAAPPQKVITTSDPGTILPQKKIIESIITIPTVTAKSVVQNVGNFNVIYKVENTSIPMSGKEFKYDNKLRSFSSTVKTPTSALHINHEPTVPQPIRIKHLPLISGFKQNTDESIIKNETIANVPTVIPNTKIVDTSNSIHKKTEINNYPIVINRDQINTPAVQAENDMRAYTESPNVNIKKEELPKRKDAYQQSSSALEITHLTSIEGTELSAEELLRYLVGPDAGGYGKKISSLVEAKGGKDKTERTKQSGSLKTVITAKSTSVKKQPEVNPNTNVLVPRTTNNFKSVEPAVYHQEVSSEEIAIPASSDKTHSPQTVSVENSDTPSKTVHETKELSTPLPTHVHDHSSVEEGSTQANVDEPSETDVLQLRNAEHIQNNLDAIRIPSRPLHQQHQLLHDHQIHQLLQPNQQRRESIVQNKEISGQDRQKVESVPVAHSVAAPTQPIKGNNTIFHVT